MKKIITPFALVGMMLLPIFAHAATFSSAKPKISFEYQEYKKQKPAIDGQLSMWYYLPNTSPAWTISVPTKPQSGMPNTFDDYGIIRVRAFYASDIDYKSVLTALKQNDEVKKIKKQTINRKKALVFEVSGESASAETLIFGNNYVLNIEKKWSNTKNVDFQKVIKSIKF